MHIDTVKIPNLGTVLTARYASLADMARDVGARATKSMRKTIEGNPNWSGTGDFDQTVRDGIIGVQQEGDATAELLDKLPAMLETMGRRWSNAVAGHVPDVARYCAMLPDAMRSRRVVADEHNPLHVVACVNSSASIGMQTLRKRGAAILAIASGLSAVRPITLLAVTCWKMGNGTVTACVTEIGASPLDMNIAAAALQSTPVIRGLMYTANTLASGGERMGSLPWPFDVRPSEESSSAKFALLMRAVVGLDETEDALVIPGAFLYHPSVQDPVKWASDMLALYAPGGELAAA